MKSFHQKWNYYFFPENLSHHSHHSLHSLIAFIHIYKKTIFRKSSHKNKKNMYMRIMMIMLRWSMSYESNVLEHSRKTSAIPEFIQLLRYVYNIRTLYIQQIRYGDTLNYIMLSRTPISPECTNEFRSWYNTYRWTNQACVH